MFTGYDTQRNENPALQNVETFSKTFDRCLAGGGLGPGARARLRGGVLHAAVVRGGLLRAHALRAGRAFSRAGGG